MTIEDALAFIRRGKFGGKKYLVDGGVKGVRNAERMYKLRRGVRGKVEYLGESELVALAADLSARAVRGRRARV